MYLQYITVAKYFKFHFRSLLVSGKLNLLDLLLIAADDEERERIWLWMMSFFTTTFGAKFLPVLVLTLDNYSEI